MAAIGVALWKYVMRYSPENPNFFNRDRFVLSNGKGPALLLRAEHSWDSCLLTILPINQATPASGSTRLCTSSGTRT